MRPPRFARCLGQSEEPFAHMRSRHPNSIHPCKCQPYSTELLRYLDPEQLPFLRLRELVFVRHSFGQIQIELGYFELHTTSSKRVQTKVPSSVPAGRNRRPFSLRLLRLRLLDLAGRVPWPEGTS